MRTFKESTVNWPKQSGEPCAEGWVMTTSPESRRAGGSITPGKSCLARELSLCPFHVRTCIHFEDKLRTTWPRRRIKSSSISNPNKYVNVLEADNDTHTHCLLNMPSFNVVQQFVKEDHCCPECFHTGWNSERTDHPACGTALKRGRVGLS